MFGLNLKKEKHLNSDFIMKKVKKLISQRIWLLCFLNDWNVMVRNVKKVVYHYLHRVLMYLVIHMKVL